MRYSLARIVVALGVFFPPTLVFASDGNTKKELLIFFLLYGLGLLLAILMLVVIARRPAAPHKTPREKDPSE